jgi:uncharacterized repeat protein (TIGR02543 family)
MTVESASGPVDITASGDYNSVAFAEVDAASGVTVHEADGASVQLNDSNGELVAEKAIGYKISFRSMGGAPVEAIVNIAPDTKAPAPPNPVLEGYVFGGWYTDEDYTEVWSFSESVTSDMTLFAKWRPDGSTNGPTEGPTGSHTVTLRDGAATLDAFERRHNAVIGALPALTKMGHTFLGWYTAASGGSRIDENEILTADMICYARWAANEYTVSFDVNGGDALPALEASRIVAYGSAVSALPAPTRPGHRFRGWFTAPSDGAQIDESTPVTADVTYYAHWETATPQSEAGAPPSPAPVTPSPETVTPSPEAVTPPGTGSVISQSQFKIIFNANGGSVSSKSMIVAGGVAVGSLPTPKRAGYAFKGWYTKKSGGVKIGADAVVTADVTYYAQWRAKAFKVTFHANKGKVSGKAKLAKSVKYNAKLGKLPTPKRKGYKFKGWYTKKSGGAKIKSSTKAPARNVTYYAQWRKK